MTTLIEKIKIAQLQARKMKQTVAANLLTTLLGEAEMVGKNDGNRAPTDAEVVAMVKKFLKNANETAALIKHPEAREDLAYEIHLLEDFLPTQITGVALKSIIEAIIVEIGAQPKDMGKVMALLKSRFDGQYDGKEASSVVKEVLAQ